MVKEVYLISIFIWCKTKQKIYLFMHKKVFICMILRYFSYLLVANFKSGQFNFVFICVKMESNPKWLKQQKIHLNHMKNQIIFLLLCSSYFNLLSYVNFAEENRLNWCKHLPRFTDGV